MNIVEAITDLKKAILESVNVAKPCKVTKVYDNFVNVEVDGYIFYEVPVWQFNISENVGLFLPISKGTTGNLLFFDESIEAFQNESKIPSETHQHNLSDCLFIPGFLSDKKRPNNPDNVELKNGSSKIEVSDGKMSIGNGSVELIENCIDVMTTLSSTLEKLAIGLATGVVAEVPVEWLDSTFLSGLGALKAEVELLKTSLEGLKL